MFVIMVRYSDYDHKVWLNLLPQDLSPNLQKLRSTPALDKVRSAVQSQLENSLMSKSFTIQAERESPGLTRLRQTPGRKCYASKYLYFINIFIMSSRVELFPFLVISKDTFSVPTGNALDSVGCLHS